MELVNRKESIEFALEYGKSWKSIEHKLFLWILMSCFAVTFILILIIANLDYKNIHENISYQITQKYLKTLFSEIKIGKPESKKDTFSSYSTIPFNEKLLPPNDEKLSINSTESEVENLKSVIDNLPEALLAVRNKSDAKNNFRPIQQNDTKEVETENMKSFDPWATPVKRKGKIQIEPVEEIIRGGQFVRGWRDPQEITYAIQKKEPIIEYCFKREAKYFSDLQGYVVVRFIISYNGSVDPNSVKIIESTLHNKKIEICIKKRLQYWRGFKKLEEEHGSVAVIQKFIFN